MARRGRAPVPPFGQALIVGKFAPFHAGHQLLVETALAESRRLMVMVYSNPDFPDMPQQVRAGWIRTIYPGIDVHEPHDPPPDASPDWVHRDFVARYLHDNTLAVDVVFTSETYGEGFAAHLGVAHRLVDLDRTAVPVSGTLIRSNPRAYSQYLHPLVYRDIVAAA